MAPNRWMSAYAVALALSLLSLAFFTTATTWRSLGLLAVAFVHRHWPSQCIHSGIPLAGRATATGTSRWAPQVDSDRPLRSKTPVVRGQYAPPNDTCAPSQSLPPAIDPRVIP